MFDPDTQRKLDHLLHDALAPSTRAIYARDLHYVTLWHQARIGTPLPWPASVEVVMQFAIEHLTELPEATEAVLIACGFKATTGAQRATTVRRRLAAWAAEHTRRCLPNPCADPGVRLLLRRGARRDRSSLRLTAALTPAHLDQVLATCDNSLAGRRDAALLLLAYDSGGRRRSELAAAQVHDIAPAGDGAWWFTVRQAKQASQPLVVPIRGRAAMAVSAWLAATGHHEGPLFRRISRGGRLGAGLTDDGIADILTRRFSRAGLPAAYSAHSLRAGFITDAATRGEPVAGIMARSGHTSVTSCWRYVRTT